MQYKTYLQRYSIKWSGKLVGLSHSATFTSWAVLMTWPQIGEAPALFVDIRVVRKYLTETNTLAYFAITALKGFVAQALECFRL